MMDEHRRQARRQAEELLIICDSQTGAFFGQVANITAQGAMLLSKKPVQPNTTVQCRMTLPKRTHGDACISFDAECKWCRLDEKTGMYRTGYEFQKMGPEDQAVIQAMLEFWPMTQSQTVKT